uniref:Secreted protein n=1 Tax=Zea mays TaxID=4577 RepID=C4J3W4_MAIZE|nr:unknown [Zea mays]
MAAMLASKAWAVQMLLVALSRRMCCSRVCIAMRSAGLPVESTLTPMIRPGMRRLYSCDVARNAACGPPYPMGTPKRCAEPTAMSAPISPGGRSAVSASRSVAMTTLTPWACASRTNSA